jgi:5-methylcytosine-specific restriction endonuclease McrA
MSGQRRNMPTEKAIRDHWKEWVERRINDPDESEPGNHLCFACGFYWPSTERAHITARCNGGGDTVHNLHMLCHVCHKSSEFVEGADYWHWIKQWNIGHCLYWFRSMALYGTYGTHGGPE